MNDDNLSSLDLTAPCFSQGELCEVAGITSATANNWIHTGLLKPASFRSRGRRKPRLFSVITIFHARVTGSLVEKFQIQASTAASIAEATTKNRNWMSSVIHKKKQNSYWRPFATVFPSEMDSPEGNKFLIEIKTSPERKDRAEVQTGPYLIICVAHEFASVYRQCEAILSESPVTRGE